MNGFETLELSPLGNGVTMLSMSRPDVFNAFDAAMITELERV
jgi:enoyl-CoA hydratase/carnithine racemase